MNLNYSTARRQARTAGWLQTVIVRLLFWFGVFRIANMNVPHYFCAVAFSSSSSSRSPSVRPLAIRDGPQQQPQNQQQNQQQQQVLLLQDLQQRAAPVVESFQVDTNFDPPAWLRNKHVQTIGGYLWRELGTGSYVDKSELPLVTALRLGTQLAKAWLVKQQQRDQPPTQSSFWHHRERVETPDGDWFHADSRQQRRPGQPDTPTVIIVHGLESNTESPVVQQMAVTFETKHNMNVVGLNFRGCSGIPNDTIGSYHLGFTDDLRLYLDLLRQRQPQAPIYLAGFSLGANIVLKCLGELGAQAVTDYNIAGAAVLAAPLDQRYNAPQLATPGINRSVYSKNLMRTMKERVQYSVDRFCNGNVDTSTFDYHRAMKADNIMELENAFLAPVFGFRDCWDYYDQTSSIHFLDTIAVPTFILNAEDDPFLDSTVWPVEKTCGEGGSLPLVMVRSRYGGHLGYLLHQVTAFADDDDDHSDQRWRDPGSPSWAANELGRFLGHVHHLHHLPPPPPQ